MSDGNGLPIAGWFGLEPDVVLTGSGFDLSVGSTAEPSTSASQDPVTKDEDREDVLDTGETAIVSTLPIRLIVGGAAVFAAFALWSRYR